MTTQFNNTFTRITLAISLLTLASPGTAVGETVDMYELTVLTIAEGSMARAYSINNSGQVVGWADIGETRHAAYWHNESATDLHGTVHFALLHPIFDVGYGESYAISDGGQIVGTARTNVDCFETQILCTHGFVLRAAVLTDLATPYPGDALTNLMTFGNPCLWAYDSAATGISNNGHVVGWADREDGTIHAFVIHPPSMDSDAYFEDQDEDAANDNMIDLGTLSSADPVSSATDVNDLGQVVGWSYAELSDGSVAYHGFVINPRQFADGGDVVSRWYPPGDDPGGINSYMEDIGTLFGGTNSWSRAINDSGLVVGESGLVTAEGEIYTHAFLVTPQNTGAGGALAWYPPDADPGGTNTYMTDLGTLQSDSNAGFSAASGINSSGTIVGWAENDDRERRAFVYKDGEMQDLNDLIYLVDDEGFPMVPDIILTEARDINDNGVIVGWGTVRNASTITRGFLLTPVQVDSADLEGPSSNDSDDDDSVAPGDDIVDGSSETGNPGDFVAPDAGSDPASTIDSGGGLGGFCGMGSLAMVPLTLAGLTMLRLGRRYR